MGHAAGEKKKLPVSGELIVTRDGTPLIVLGRPSADETDGDDIRFMRMLRGTVVVLLPDGTPALHMIDTHPSRPDFISPWELGWTAIDEANRWDDLIGP